MKKYLLIINIIFSLSYAAIINVGQEGLYDFNTIQSGIDNALTGDTVLVHPGVYYENIILDKSITLTSLAIFDNLDNWFEYNNLINQYEVINDNIINTIIDGSYADFSGSGGFGPIEMENHVGSSIFVASFNDECISPIITGFTIQNGLGTISWRDGWYGYYKKRGGGIFSYMSDPRINYNNFRNNGLSDIEYGGAIYFQTEPLSIYDNFGSLNSCEFTEINLQNNFYDSNYSKFANTFSSKNFYGDLHLENSLFDVFDCSDTSFTKIWLDVPSETNIYYSGIQTNRCASTNDIWVSNSGIDSPESGDIENPLKTIRYALEIISPSLSNNITIHLDEGIYSQRSGERLSLNLLPYTNLKGAGRDQTIIDGGLLMIYDSYYSDDSVFTPPFSIMQIHDSENTTISDLSIVGGMRSSSNDLNHAAGITIINSNVSLINTNISGHYGGAITAISSVLNLKNTVISRNQGWLYNTAGIELVSSIANLNNITFADNIAGLYAGSINMDDSSNLNMINSIVWNFLYEDENLPIGFSMGIDDDFNLINIIHSNIQGGWPGGGQGNISLDPLFVDAIPEIDEDNPSASFSPFGDFTLEGSSPCVDSGIDFFELNGETLIDLDESEFLGSAPDMGANEYYELNYGDVNYDDSIDILDIVFIVSLVLDNQFNQLGDVNQDGFLNVLDIVNLVDTILNPVNP